MKGRALILIFLFLIFPCVSAEYTDYTNVNVSSVGYDITERVVSEAGGNSLVFNSLLFGDGIVAQRAWRISLYVNNTYWVGSSASSGRSNVTYHYDGAQIGTGEVGFWRVNTDGVPGYDWVYVNCWIDDGLPGLPAGDVHVEVEGDILSSIVISDEEATAFIGWSEDPGVGLIGRYYDCGSWTFAAYRGEHDCYVEYNYFTNFSYGYNEKYHRFDFNLTRDSGNLSMILLNNGYVDIINETDYSGTSLDEYSVDLDNSSWTLDIDNAYGESFSYNWEFQIPSISTGVISFNKSFYTDPENIEVEWDVDSFDSDVYTYEIQVITSVSGNPSQDSWPADGNWNTSPFISSASGAAVFDFYSDGYDLPIWIQGELWAQDKSTGTWTRLDSTPVVIYHEKSDFGVGSIWTEKSTYNLSEMFYIFVETDYSIIDIELISDTYHDRQTLEVFEGGWQRLGYAFFSPHNFTAYLYEDGVITNQTSFSVWTTSPMMNIFLDSEALKTPFSFEFYTDNSSDTITGYKPDGSIFYGPITDLETGGRKIIRGASSSSPPGIYTISLFHDGTTYYNDTIELYSTSEYVYFEASKYETGDRIKIYSFVTDSRQQVRLTDSIGTAVITWTDSAGYIVPNGQTVLYFSLTDNNEYGMNINTSIDAGTFRTGNWKVEIIGIDGKPLTNESTYDYATVSKRIESPTDSSNEMISIFFSPEGAFLLFTVCLTMMGLGIAKHPAGGGAGAVVGTGFGVYFNVLPPWMLMLTVILLVVLGGVSVAVYYRGK